MQQNNKDEDRRRQLNDPSSGVKWRRRINENHPADEQSPKNAPGQESLGERIKEGAERAVEEVEQEVAAAQEGAEKVVEVAQQEVATARRPWYQTRRWGSVLLVVLAVLLVLFGLLAWWVASHPILAIDITITRDFQENQALWLRTTMIAVSYIGNMQVLSVGLVALSAVLFWMVDLRLEAITVVVVSATSAFLNALLKFIVARPRPSAGMVEIIQAASGNSFPSSHVMSYVALWGLLFSFGIILFRGFSWWRNALLVVSALFVVLVGPSRVYLGDHWASDVLGAYLLSGILLGAALWMYLYLRGRNVLAPKGNIAERFRKYW